MPENFTAEHRDGREVGRELDGVAARIGAQQCLLVSWSGITIDAEREIRTLFFRTRVWTADDLFRELTAVYDKLPEQIQAELPSNAPGPSQSRPPDLA